MTTTRKLVLSEQASLIEQVQRIAEAGAMFAPFTEVVVHDLRTPKYAILAIHNNLSGRAVGDPATEARPRPHRGRRFPARARELPEPLRRRPHRESTSIGIRIRPAAMWPRCA